MKLIALVALSVVILAEHSLAQNTGNTKLGGGTLIFSKDLKGHSREDIVGYIKDNTDPALGQEIDDKTGENGCIKIVEAWWSATGQPGYSDSGTIAVCTRKGVHPVPLWYAAVVVVHEYGHAKLAGEAAPGDPDAPDPGMQDECGDCREAENTAGDGANILTVLCAPGTDAAMACDEFGKARKRASDQLDSCKYAGCTGWESFPQGVPSISALFPPTPPCCASPSTCCEQ